ncbi:ABC transporter ATP-binding protein [Roseomonas sp. OT10]|uniref:ABC transporter ATP-binding protein n=1 Tax=Roseomonas cutis TaxID=2897332 RepID=UPI001E4D5405|nr:ABC transporter ATP-binding protein [Roseomonas sp. OT10]UFN48832.1 ABC transporter ATP-binding protein [Roseomonas sp. OT10]
MSEAPVLSVRGLEVGFATARGLARAVAGVSLELRPGERLGLVGESGSGKTTTALALMRLIRPPGRVLAGEVRLEGRDLLAASPAELRRLRGARIALVPQGAMNALNPVLTCGAQFEDLFDAHGVPRRGRRERIAALLESVGLEPAVMHRHPHELSGGMKQRVCIALAIALRPAVIVADEPTSALDVIVQKQVLRTLLRVQREIGAAVVMVGHDMGLMAQFAQRIGVMYAGRLVELGPVREIFARPRHPYTRALIESLPGFGPRGVFRGIAGVAPSLLSPPPGCPFHPRCPRAEARCLAEAPGETWLAPDHLARCHFAREAVPLAA